MEILHAESNRRTILVTLNYSAEAAVLTKTLGEYYNLIQAYSAEECLRIMRERAADLSAVVIDFDMAKSNDYAFLHTATTEILFDTIPVIVATLREPTDEDMNCLDEGASDFFTQPFYPRQMKRRIDNAIRLKQSTTFYEIEAMLRELPSNIFLKDAEGRYVFSTHYWHHLDTGGDPNWTIRGKTDLEIRKDRENAIKAMEADKEIIRSGKGTTYTIEINADGVQEFMELIKRPVFDKHGNVTGIIALINDVTETELLKRELEQRARTDGLTGLQNRRAFEEEVDSIPEKGHFPIGVISADCDELKRVNDTLGHPVGDEYIHMAAAAFKHMLPDEAKTFRTGGDEFIALLPHTTLEQAEEIMHNIQKTAALFKLEHRNVSISCGAAVINGPDDNPRDAIARADRNMYADKASRKLART